MDEQGPQRDTDAVSKEVRLHLPLQTHLLLHELKIVRNLSIRDAVVTALELYFERHPLEDQSPRTS